METIEGNKLIAEFMGLSEDNYPKGLPKWVNIWGRWEDNVDKIEYHSSWDWLMPVVDKIAKDYDVRITWMPTALNVTYIDRPDAFDDEITSMGGMSAIENTWHAVVRFIKWYNKNKK